MKHLDLFSGIGGFSLACQWAGIETIGFIEIDKYCQKVLRKHWPDVPIVEDIRDVAEIEQIVTHATRGRLQQCEVWREQANDLSEVDTHTRATRNHNGTEPAILITAGFPCQPFSVAGKRGGKEDDRYLWPETLAVIKAIKPEWVLLENVTGIINLALDDVLSDLEGAGYSTETLVIPACAVNAWHRRDRVWIVANTERNGRQELSGNLAEASRTPRREGSQFTEGVVNSSQDVPTTQRAGLEGADATGSPCRAGQPSEYGQGEWQADWWAVEPELGRVAHGIPHRVDRLKCLGNAIVPQVAFEIIKVIKEVENASS